MTDRPRIVISEDELPAEPAAPPVASVAGAPSTPLPSVAGVRPQAKTISVSGTTGSSDWGVRSIRGQSTIAGLCAVIPGWAIGEVLGIPEWEATSESAINLNAALWVAILGALFSLVYNGWDDIRHRQWSNLAVIAPRAILVGALVGAISGFLAQVVYSAIFKSIVKDLTFEDAATLESNFSLYLARAAGWGIFGAGVGAATALFVRSTQKLQNGVIGGIAGGAVGGLIFHWLGWNMDSGALARLLGLLAVGGGIGLAIGLVEVARRDAWFHVTSGAMKGKEFILYENETRVGASPKCEITLVLDPGIQPYHFVIQPPDARQVRLLQSFEGAAVTVNDVPTTSHALNSGDVIQAGQTVITYAERPSSQ